MSVNNKNILITGIGGFVGSYIAKTLIDQGAKVYGILRRRADGRCAEQPEKAWHSPRGSPPGGGS